MIYVYLVAAAAALPLLDNFINVFHRQNSWWQVPLIFIGIFLGLIILNFIVGILMFPFTGKIGRWKIF